jgi:hypothetical protein
VREEIEALKHDQIRSILGRLDPAKLARMRGAVQDLREALADELEDAGHPDHVHNH